MLKLAFIFINAYQNHPYPNTYFKHKKRARIAGSNYCDKERPLPLNSFSILSNAASFILPKNISPSAITTKMSSRTISASTMKYVYQTISISFSAANPYSVSSSANLSIAGIIKKQIIPKSAVTPDAYHKILQDRSLCCITLSFLVILSPPLLKYNKPPPLYHKRMRPQSCDLFSKNSTYTWR